MLGAWLWCVNTLGALAVGARDRLARRGEEGQSTVEWMAIATLATVTLVGIFALVKIFGDKVMTFIGNELGV